MFGVVVRDSNGNIIFDGNDSMLSVLYERNRIADPPAPADIQDRFPFSTFWLSNDVTDLLVGFPDTGFGMRVLTDEGYNSMSADHARLVPYKLIGPQDFVLQTTIPSYPEGISESKFRMAVDSDVFLFPSWITPPRLPKRSTGDNDTRCGLNNIWPPVIRGGFAEISVEWRQYRADGVDVGYVFCWDTIALSQVYLGEYLLLRKVGKTIYEG